MGRKAACQYSQAVAMLMREMGVDIAVDLAGPTQNSRERIFAYRPAPVQVRESLNK